MFVNLFFLVAHLVEQCCELNELTPSQVTKHFFTLILDELKRLGFQSVCELRGVLINQLSLDLVECISQLNSQCKGDPMSPIHEQKMKDVMIELKRKDESISDLLAQKTVLYNQLESLCINNYRLLNKSSNPENNSNCSVNDNNQDAESLDFCSEQPTNSYQNCPSSGSSQYFDEGVVTAAAISAQLTAPGNVKNEPDQNVGSDCVFIKFSDIRPTHMMV